MTPAPGIDRPTLDRIVPLVEKVRAALLDGRAAPEDAPRSSAPEMSDEKIREGTGHGWDEWVALVAAGPGKDARHDEIATWVMDTYELPGWWSHGVAVGVRRLTGQRVPGQMADGSFAVSRTKTLPTTETDLREVLLDGEARGLLLPGLDVTLRSRATSKALRLALVADDRPAGSILFTLAPAGEGRCRTTVSHEKLGSSVEGDVWKAFWGDWLQVVEDALRA